MLHPFLYSLYEYKKLRTPSKIYYYFQTNVASSGNTSHNEATKKRGRHRRVIIDEFQTPNTSNNMDNAIPRPEPREPIPPARNERRQNELVAEQLFTLLW